MTTITKHSVAPENVLKFREWFATRGGLAIWHSINLSNPSGSWTTPALAVDGTPTLKPTWQAADAPERLITDPSEVVVTVAKEVKRFHVAVKRGGGLMLKLTDGGTRKVRAAVAKAGPDAWHEFDYTTQEAVIFVPGIEVPLPEWTEAP